MKRTLASVANKLVLKYAAESGDFFDLADKVDSGLGIDRGDASYDVQGLGHQTNPENFKLDVEEAEAVLHDVKRVGLSLNGGKFPGTKASEAHRLMVEVSDRLRELRALLQNKI